MKWRVVAALIAAGAAASPAQADVVWRMKQAAIQVKHESGRYSDPWPNCADPWDGGTWWSLKWCESRATPWGVDPPGYYCGPFQLDPAYWGHVIRRWGVPC